MSDHDPLECQEVDDGTNLDDESALARIVDEAVSLGSEFDADQFCNLYPCYAKQIRALIPSIQVLGRFAVDAPDALPHDSAEESRIEGLGRLGDFELLREIGRGGMGIVYEAEQVSLSRRVAVKVLPFASLLDADQLQRFRKEARAAGSLHHPNIVHAFFVGCEHGTHYYTMRYIEGKNLSDVIADMKMEETLKDDSRSNDAKNDSLESNGESCRASELSKRPVGKTCSAQTLVTTRNSRPIREFHRSVARLGEQAADALEFAHSKGIIHRDIKPSNLVVDMEGHIWITDFGLAAVQSEATMTLTGDFLGTLRYAAPEQLDDSCNRLDPRSDIYSLGATLYELLTLQPVVPGKKHAEVLAHLENSESVPLHKIDRRIPKDLCNVIMKAVARRPEDRYPSAREFRDDLQRFIDHRPVRARRLSRAQVLLRSIRRKPMQAGLVTTTLLCLVVLAIGGPMAALQQRAARNKLLSQTYSLTMAAAYEALNSFDAVEARRQLDNVAAPDYASLKGFEFTHIAGRLEHVFNVPIARHPASVMHARFLKQDTQFVTSCEDGIVRFWDRESMTVQREFRVTDRPITALALSADEQMLAVGAGNSITLWSVATMTRVAAATISGRYSFDLEFSGDSRYLAGAVDDSPVRSISIWALRQDDSQQVELVPMAKHPHHGSPQVCFSPDSKSLISCSDQGGAKLWAVDEDAGLLKIRDLPTANGVVAAAAFSPDGKWLATAGETTELWRTSDWKRHAVIEQYTICSSVQFGPDSRYLVTAGVDPIRVWNVISGKNISVNYSRFAKLQSLSISSCGRYLLTATNEGAVRLISVTNPPDTSPASATVWRFAHGCDVAEDRSPNDYRYLVAAVSPRDQTLVEPAPTLDLINLATLERTPLERGVRTYVGITVAAERPYLFAVGGFAGDGQSNVDIWDLRHPKKIRTMPIEFNGFLSGVALSRSGRFLAVSGSEDEAFDNNVLGVWDVSQPTTRPKWKRTDVGAISLVLSPDDRYLVASGGSFLQGVCEIIDFETGKTVHRLPVHETLTMCSVFGPSGQSLACGDWHGGFRVWNWSSKGIILDAPRKRTRQTTRPAFVGDDRTLAVPTQFEIEIWRTDTQHRIARLPVDGHVNAAYAVGSDLIAVGRDGRVLIWRANGEYQEVPAGS